jgi:predicted GNAT family acetyltransferase
MRRQGSASRVDSGIEGLEFQLVHEGRRYVALLRGEEVAFSEVDPISNDGLLIKHTEVLEAFEGRGIGSALIRHMLEDARRQGRGVIPICPYTATFIVRHPEYLDYVRESYRAALPR